MSWVKVSFIILDHTFINVSPFLSILGSCSLSTSTLIVLTLLLWSYRYYFLYGFPLFPLNSLLPIYAVVLPRTYSDIFYKGTKIIDPYYFEKFLFNDEYITPKTSFSNSALLPFDQIVLDAVNSKHLNRIVFRRQSPSNSSNFVCPFINFYTVETFHLYVTSDNTNYSSLNPKLIAADFIYIGAFGFYRYKHSDLKAVAWYFFSKNMPQSFSSNVYCFYASYQLFHNNSKFISYLNDRIHAATFGSLGEDESVIYDLYSYARGYFIVLTFSRIKSPSVKILQSLDTFPLIRINSPIILLDMELSDSYRIHSNYSAIFRESNFEFSCEHDRIAGVMSY